MSRQGGGSPGPRDPQRMRAAMHAIRPPRSEGETRNRTVTAAGLMAGCLLFTAVPMGAPWQAMTLGLTATAAIAVAGIICQLRFRTWRKAPPHPSAQLGWLRATTSWQLWPLAVSPAVIVNAVAGALMTSGRPFMAALMVVCVTVIVLVGAVYSWRCLALLKSLIAERERPASEG